MPNSNHQYINTIIKMKKYKYILSIVTTCIVLLLRTACEDILKEDPISVVSDSKFWKTNEDADLGVAAIYDAMQKTYRVNRFYWGEYRADNYVVSDKPSGQTEDLLNNQLTPETEEYLRWNELYKMVFRANTAIEKIPQIPQYDPHLLGEAYACRAYAYFDAYRVWGGVPLFKDAALIFDESSFKARSTPEEVLALVLSDILYLDFLPSASISDTALDKLLTSSVETSSASLILSRMF